MDVLYSIINVMEEANEYTYTLEFKYFSNGSILYSSLTCEI